MQEQLDSIEKDVSQIKDALIGNEFGNVGIVTRLKNVEKSTDGNKKDLNAIKQKSILFGTGAGGLLVGIIETIKHFFFNG
tara:strand:- start:167 stop:406 length:240 start_codon:yes stop_codon:yes gene_type:complete